MGDNVTTGESDRRLFLKRAGVVAGATVWATPVIQSVASPAFATGSPAVECPPDKLVRFKFNVGGSFDSGLPTQGSEAGSCLAQVDSYYATGTRAVDTRGCFSADGCTVCVKVTVSADKKTATIKVEGGTIKDVDIKGGSSNSPKGHCTDGDPSGDGTTAVVQVPVDGAAISFVGGVICPTC